MNGGNAAGRVIAGRCKTTGRNEAFLLERKRRIRVKWSVTCEHEIGLGAAVGDAKIWVTSSTEILPVTNRPSTSGGGGKNVPGQCAINTTTAQSTNHEKGRLARKFKLPEHGTPYGCAHHEFRIEGKLQGTLPNLLAG